MDRLELVPREDLPTNPVSPRPVMPIDNLGGHHTMRKRISAAVVLATFAAMTLAQVALAMHAQAKAILH